VVQCFCQCLQVRFRCRLLLLGLLPQVLLALG
jgi:hypothetical protein